jgi:hypothetical protein
MVRRRWRSAASARRRRASDWIRRRHHGRRRSGAKKCIGAEMTRSLISLPPRLALREPISTRLVEMPLGPLGANEAGGGSASTCPFCRATRRKLWRGVGEAAEFLCGFLGDFRESAEHRCVFPTGAPAVARRPPAHRARSHLPAALTCQTFSTTPRILSHTKAISQRPHARDRTSRASTDRLTWACDQGVVTRA